MKFIMYQLSTFRPSSIWLLGRNLNFILNVPTINGDGFSSHFITMTELKSYYEISTILMLSVRILRCNISSFVIHGRQNHSSASFFLTVNRYILTFLKNIVAIC